MGKKKTFCKNSKRYKSAKLLGEFIGILNKLLKSILFNIFIFISGFATCYFMLQANSIRNRKHDEKKNAIVQSVNATNMMLTASRK